MYLNDENDCLRAEKQVYILYLLSNHVPNKFTALMKSLKEESKEVHHNLSCRYYHGVLPRQPVEDINKFLESKKEYQLVEPANDMREY